MKLGFSQQEIITTAKSLGLPTDGFVQRRVARAIDILESNKVNEIDDGIFRVHSQYDENKSYIVNVNHGAPYCDCPDGERTINCKHRIASLLYQRQAKEDVKVTWDDTENSYHKRGRWWVTDYKRKVKYIVYRDGNGRFICPCGKKKDCEHRKAIREYLGNNGGGNGNGSKITNECGSEHAKALQDKLNGQLDSQGNNGNGAYCAPSLKLDISDPFQEAEQNDIDQIEGRKNGELAWKLSNGEYCISYKGIMTLAEKHNISFSVSLHDETNTVIAKAQNGSERISGKEVRICGFATTASELANRNAARQLLPLPEIKAIEKKYQLEQEFSWETAYQKCQELAGGKAQCDIVIEELVKSERLPKKSPSEMSRKEWLVVYHTLKADPDHDDGNNNDGGDDSPSSNDDEWKAKLKECKDTALNETRFDWLKSDLQSEGVISDKPITDWQDSDFETLKQACALDASLFNRALGDFSVIKERNYNDYDYSRRYRFWIVTNDTEQLREKCFVCGKTKGNVKQLSDDMIYWERYEVKISLCNECETTTTEALTKRFDELYHASPNAVQTVGLPKKAEEFITKCREAIDKVREKKKVEAAEQPLEGGNGKRKLQMDKKLRTWLVETDGTKKEISCREICETFNDGSIITRLRQGIDCGADLSTVELD